MAPSVLRSRLAQPPRREDHEKRMSIKLDARANGKESSSGE
jgi:hypothetical protein